MASSKFARANSRRRRPVRRRPSLLRFLKTSAGLALFAILFLLTIGAIYMVVLFVQTSRALPSITDIANFSPEESTRLYYSDLDRNGKPKLMAILAAANRKPMKLDELGKKLQDATIAVEDARFYEHSGVDYIGIGRALLRNVTGGNLRGEGASTITQQLARNISALGLTREKVIQRKVAEAILARRIEELFTKPEILELYLNTIYYGNGAYGAEAAARAYFHKSAARLTLSQAAYLAGLPQRPVRYSNNKKAALARRDVVLDRMVETGKITAFERDEARKEVIRTHKAHVKGNQIFGAPYFVDWVVKQLVRLYGTDKVHSGLQVYTTLDSRVQDLAEEVLAEGVRRSGCANQGALVCMDNRTGFIRAMVGGVDYERDQFNVVTQGCRQPGSAFKPIVYTAAIDSGICDLDTTYRDDTDFPWKGRDKWIPQNYGGSYSYASVSVRNAIRRSLNTIAVKVAVRVGIPVVIEYARRMGITTDLAPYPPLALGASGVRPIELCSAYSAFANSGKRGLPGGVQRVLERNGDIADEFGPQLEDTRIQPATFAMMNEALEGVVRSGTATAAAPVPGAHGKTGTTNNNIDAWFAGYTPELTTIIWVAREQRAEGKPIRYKEMPGATGGRVCAPIWRDFMLKAVPLQQEADRAAAERATEAPPPPKKTARPDDEEPEPGAVERAPVPESDVSEPEPAPGSADEVPLADPASQPAAPIAEPPRAPPAPERPAPRADPGAEVIRIRVCAESGRVATPYCPITIERTMPRRNAPGSCRAHRAPPGEE